MFNIGSVVKFHTPMLQNEVTERFVVIEDSGDRLLLEMVCNMNLKPTTVLPAYLFERA